MSWLLPPAVGVLLGFLLGVLVLARIARAFVLGRGSPVSRAAAEEAGSLGTQLIAMRAASVLPAEGTEAARRLQGVVAGIFRGVLGSRGTIYAVRNAVSRLVTNVASRGVGDTARQVGVESLLSEKVLAALGSERNRSAIAESAGGLVSREAGAAMDDEVIQGFTQVLESALPDLAEAVVRWLESPETRADLSVRGRELLPRIIEKLTDLQKLFLGAAQFDRRLNEKMPEIVDETVAALEKMARDPIQQARILGVFSDALRGWRSTLSEGGPGGTDRAQAGRERLAVGVSRLVDRALGRLSDPGRRKEVAARASAGLDQDPRRLGLFARETLGLRDQEVAEAMSDWLLRLLTGPEVADRLASGLVGSVLSRAHEQQDITLASALGVGNAAQAEVEALIRSRAPGLVHQALGRLMDAPTRRRGLGLALGALGAAAGLLAGVAADLLRAWGLA